MRRNIQLINLTTDLLQFSHCPKPLRKDLGIATMHLPNFLFVLFSCYIAMFALAMGGAALFQIPLKMLDIMPKNPQISGISIFMAVLVAPIAEEIVFRLPLIFSKRNILISVTFFLIMFNKQNLPIAIAAGSANFILLYIFLSIRKGRFERILKYFWCKHFKIIFYSIIILFGAVHITNFDNLSTFHYILLPIIVFPQIVMGFFLGYVRVRFENGFILAISLHSLNNLVAFLFMQILLR